MKSPKWQKRRLEIMNRDNFTCQLCGDKDTMLNVHHLCYHNDKNIWEYDDWEMITLCENCHKEEHSSQASILDYIESIKSRGVTMSEIYSILEAIDISLYMGHDRIIQNIVGDSSSNGNNKEYDIKLLADRRELFKKSYYEKQKSKFKQLNKDNPF